MTKSLATGFAATPASSGTLLRLVVLELGIEVEERLKAGGVVGKEYLSGLFGAVEGADCRSGERGRTEGRSATVEARSLELAGEEDTEPRGLGGGGGNCGIVESLEVRGGEFLLTRGWCLSWGRKSSDGRELVTVVCVWSCGFERGRVIEVFRITPSLLILSSTTSSFALVGLADTVVAVGALTDGLETAGDATSPGEVVVAFTARGRIVSTNS